MGRNPGRDAQMQYTGKSFQRRPWDQLSNGLIQHFDGIGVSGITKQPAFYLCFHTAAAWLIQNQISCSTAQGWTWPSITVENFSIDSLTSATGILVTDGMVGDQKFGLTIRKGKFKTLDKDSCVLNIKNVNIGSLCIENLVFTDVQNPAIILEGCTADSVTLQNLGNVVLDTSQSPSIKSVARYGCMDCKLIGNAVATDFALPKVIDGKILGSVAISVLINGEIFTTQAANLPFKESK